MSMYDSPAEEEFCEGTGDWEDPVEQEQVDAKAELMKMAAWPHSDARTAALGWLAVVQAIEAAQKQLSALLQAR